ncbi:glycoside hydrolase family 43 protein [Gorillibacterium sp. sgz5001074]|uniref:glycoside hydrolase family 43 protein n=1 Tax=Gorillibacterium sp. sgz5001074 TaxID=3446695 RepID=UPI003F667D98
MGLTLKDIQIRDPYVVPADTEGKYYLFGSTDKNIWGPGTGFDGYVSKDLEHWEGPYPVFRPEEGFYAERNFWAPEVYAYGGRYYMFATFRRRDNDLLGTAVLAADSLLGPFHPWSDGPVTPKEWSSLDGSLYVDDESQAWMVFCHEWQQVADGEVCAVRLTADLREAVGEPVQLFRASQAPWPTPFVSARYQRDNNYVTDGTFMYRAANGHLLLLWASFIHGTYALGVARSESGRLAGPWVHEEKSLFSADGGHAMIFRTFGGRLMLAVHTPNKTPDERALFVELEEQDGKLGLKES